VRGVNRLAIDGIRAMFEARGARQYSGEPVTQLAHALQSAQLAEQAGAGIELITACLLHDYGHLVNDMGETPTLRGVDDRHQYYGVNALKGLFSTAVLAPIRLHVDAKRYLCAADLAYWDSLSQDSRRSLELQGGIYSAEEAARFIAQPYAQDAVNLRRWDDSAKVAGCSTPDLEHYLSLAAQCAA
jgi:phosphonate degradation associated HDIG domain protein